MLYRMRRAFALIVSVFVPAIALAQSVPAATATPPAAETPGVRKVWTVDEVLASRRPVTQKKRVRYCQGGRFKPCVCPRDVSELVQYRPALRECNGKAAIVLSGRYLSMFSVVVRDRENRDRWPTAGFGNCTAYERDVLGLNKCSAFKIQDRFGVESDGGDAQIHCLGASGYSPLFARVSRITGKLADIPGSTNDPLVRWCLRGPDQPLN